MKHSFKISSIIIVVLSLIFLSQLIEAKSNDSGIKTVNINSADSKTLSTLPGIGKSTAEKIIAYRTEHGNFKTAEGLMKIKGIGKKKYEKIKDLLVLSDGETDQAKK